MTIKTVCGQDVPACFTPGEMAEWLRLTRLAKEGATVCEDCCTEGRKRLMKEGKCEQAKWQLVEFRFYALRWRINVLTKAQLKARCDQIK